MLCLNCNLGHNHRAVLCLFNEVFLFLFCPILFSFGGLKITYFLIPLDSYRVRRKMLDVYRHDSLGKRYKAVLDLDTVDCISKV